MNQQHLLLGLYRPEPFCLFQLQLALEVKGYGSFSCAKALEGSGEAEFTLGFGFGFESVGVCVGSLSPSRKGGWPWWVVGNTPPEPAAKPNPILFVRDLASPPEKGFSWFKMFLQRHLGAPGPPWIG